MKLVITNAHIVDPKNKISDKLNIFIENEFISEISEREPSVDDKVISADGLTASAGFIDMHVHLREPGYEHKEDIESGSKAAVAGGFTTIACMPNTKPINDSPEVTKKIIQRADEVNLLSVCPVGALTIGERGAETADYEAMKRAGVIALSDDGSCIKDDDVMSAAVQKAKTLHLPVIDHAEDFSLSKDGILNEGNVSKRLGLPGIPAESETAVIERDIRLAKDTGARIHIAHVSTAAGVEVIRRAKESGVAVTCEVTPHHLLLTEDDVERIGSNAIMKPPLRAQSDRDALVEGLADGTIDVIATDHAPHEAGAKREIKGAAFGAIGMETMLPVCLALVADGRISMERFIDAVTSSPAGILGLSDRGELAVGKRADITLFDPDANVTIDPASFRSKSRNTPFAGMHLKGKVRYTIVGGRVVYR